MAAISEAAPTPQSPQRAPVGVARMPHAGAHETVNYPAKHLEANAERSLMAHPRCRDGSGARRTPAPVWTALILRPPVPPRRLGVQQPHLPAGPRGDKYHASHLEISEPFRFPGIRRVPPVAQTAYRVADYFSPKSAKAAFGDSARAAFRALPSLGTLRTYC